MVKEKKKSQQVYMLEAMTVGPGGQQTSPNNSPPSNGWQGKCLPRTTEQGAAPGSLPTIEPAAWFYFRLLKKKKKNRVDMKTAESLFRIIYD